MLAQGPFLVVSQPVLTSQYTGPVRGAMAAGAQRTQRAIDEHTLSGFALLADIYGEPALILLRVDAPRSILQEGRKAILYFMTWFALVGLVCALVIQRIWSRPALSHIRVQRSEARHRMVLERTNQAILLLRPEEKTVIEANPAAGLLGFSKEDLIGGDMHDLLNLPKRQADEEMARCRREIRELPLRHRDGTIMTVEALATDIPHEDGEALCLMLHDITERRRFEQELLLHYHPRLDLVSDAITGMEALVRWDSPELGLVSPADFIPIAEDAGLIVEIGEWVLATACRQTLVWHQAGYDQLRISVNISARQFVRPDFVERVVNLIDESGLAPRFVELELTESSLTHNMDETIHIMRRLQTLGITISIDDFGTGYSSLNYLKRFPVNVLKIDKTFVDDMSKCAEDAAIVATIITISHHMHMRVVAEGVETSEQVRMLLKQGCEEIQGYFFSRPLPVDKFTHFLAHPRTMATILPVMENPEKTHE